MDALYYVIDAFCLLALSIIIFDIKQKGNTREQKLFYGFVITTVILCIGDLLYFIFKEQTGTTAHVMVYIGNILYFIAMVTCMYIWLLFVLEKIGLHSGKKKFWRYVWVTPAAILSIFVALTPVLPWIFKITENNHYERGPVIWLNWCVCYGYVVAALLYVIVYLIRDKDKKKRREYASLLVFSIYPFAASILQLFFTDLTLIPIGFTLALLYVYIRLQDSHVWTDTLTGLSNRKYFEKYISDRLKTINQNKPLFMMMVDIDGFKQLNDLLGHENADQVLRFLAYILEEEAKQRGRIQVARYNGDQFVLFGYDYDVRQTEEIIRSIQSRIDKQNIQNGSYSIEVSIGYVRATKDSFMNADQLMDIADSEMRKVKENKRNIAS